ncbi:hypothetical protein [Chromobacterium violaceum]
MEATLIRNIVLHATRSPQATPRSKVKRSTYNSSGNAQACQRLSLQQDFFNNFAEKSDFFRNSAPVQLRCKHTKMKKALLGKGGSFH